MWSLWIVVLRLLFFFLILVGIVLNVFGEFFVNSMVSCSGGVVIGGII